MKSIINFTNKEGTRLTAHFENRIPSVDEIVNMLEVITHDEAKELLEKGCVNDVVLKIIDKDKTKNDKNTWYTNEDVRITKRQ